MHLEPAESLIGHPHNAAKVVWPSQTILRYMIDLLYSFRQQGHPTCLNADFHLDLKWWDEFLSTRNGISFWLFPGVSAATDLEVSSDTAGSLGFSTYLLKMTSYQPLSECLV